MNDEQETDTRTGECSRWQSDKEKPGAKVRAGGSPEPVQDGWAGGNRNISGGELGHVCCSQVT